VVWSNHPEGWPGVRDEGILYVPYIEGEGNHWSALDLKKGVPWMLCALDWIDESIPDRRTALMCAQTLPLVWCCRETDESIDGRMFAPLSQNMLVRMGICKSANTAKKVLRILTREGGPLYVAAKPKKGQRFPTCYGFSWGVGEPYESDEE